MDPLEIQSDAPKHASPIRGRVSKGIKILLLFFLVVLALVSKFLSESTIIFLKLLLVFLVVPVGFIVFGVIGLNSNCANASYLPIWLIVNGILVLLVFFVGLAKEPLVSLHN